MSVDSVSHKVPENRKITTGFGSSRRKDLDKDLERQKGTR